MDVARDCNRISVRIYVYAYICVYIYIHMDTSFDRMFNVALGVPREWYHIRICTCIYTYKYTYLQKVLNGSGYFMRMIAGACRYTCTHMYI